jgi:alkyl hydroperoxide reductase subunit AhpC
MIIRNNLLKSGTILIVSLFVFINVGFAQSKIKPAIGLWTGDLQLNSSSTLPFNFDINYDLELYSFVFHNAEERIVAHEIAITGDSIFITMPFFDSEFRCKMLDGRTLTGVWINHNRKDKNVIPFNAICLEGKENKEADVSFAASTPIADGTWECSFSPNTTDSSKAVGIFTQVKRSSKITGTFLTETGDYRYLEGREMPDGTGFFVSCFDGMHAFLFKAKFKGDSLVKGQFYSGAHGHEDWVAVRNDKFVLRNPDSLTYLKKGYSKIDFSFKNTEGKMVSLSDAKYKNKVVIVQLMGSWCPNCMDETKFLSPFYDKNKAKGLDIIGLAFERTDDFNKAVTNVNRMKAKFGAKYDILITMKTGSQQASEALPMLNKVIAFPTTIYIDKKGNVRKIYTGFYGPATGENYLKYQEETNRFIEKLLKE